MKKTSDDYIYVGIQFMLFVVYMIPVTLVSITNGIILNIIGVALLILGILMGLLSLIQLNKNLSPFPTPISGSKLIETGLYKYIRHPIYTSILFALLGYALYSASFYRLLITTILLVLFYLKSRYEEKLLSQKFKEYSDYKKRTGRFIPYF